ncbi:MAG: FAD:protein FMN transferase [Novosphingobium sp.]
MGTLWSARIAGAPPSAREAIQAVLDRVIRQMSNWEADSDISRFNSAPLGQWRDLPDEMMLVLRAGLDVARASDGAFDPAIGRMVDYWGFGPAQGARSEAGPCWRAIELDGPRARRMADVALDFSGIAKGYAVDAVCHALEDLGCRHFLVEIGGELRGQGVKPDLQPWWVDVEGPPGLGVPTLRIALCGLSVATSGDYRRFRQKDGVRISHSIDPIQGAPIANSVASVTVLHQSAMWADAFATAITVLGPERGMALAERWELPVLMVERAGGQAREHLSSGLRAMLD